MRKLLMVAVLILVAVYCKGADEKDPGTAKNLPVDVKKALDTAFIKAKDGQFNARITNVDDVLKILMDQNYPVIEKEGIVSYKISNNGKDTYIMVVTKTGPQEDNKCFCVEGKADVEAKADFANFTVYMKGDWQIVSENAENGGRAQAVASVNEKIENLRNNLTRAFRNDPNFTLSIEKTGEPAIQSGTELKEYPTIKPVIKYHFIALQKIIVTVNNKSLKEINKSIISFGGSFFPIKGKMEPTTIDSSLTYDKKLVVTAARKNPNGTESFQYLDINDPRIQGDKEVSNNFLGFSLCKDNQKRYEEQLFRRAMEEALSKARLVSKELGVQLENMSPSIEIKIDNKFKEVNDYGTIMLKGTVSVTYRK